MFGDLNKVMLMGNITNDPELRFTTGGTGVLSFGIATNRNYKSGEEWKDEVTYHNIVVWRNAESLAKRVKKGTKIFIEGRIGTRSWDGSDGEKKYKTEITADSVSLIARYEGEGQKNSDMADATPSNSSSSEDINPDDLPF